MSSSNPTQLIVKEKLERLYRELICHKFIVSSHSCLDCLEFFMINCWLINFCNIKKVQVETYIASLFLWLSQMNRGNFLCQCVYAYMITANQSTSKSQVTPWTRSKLSLPIKQQTSLSATPTLRKALSWDGRWEKWGADQWSAAKDKKTRCWSLKRISSAAETTGTGQTEICPHAHLHKHALTRC